MHDYGALQQQYDNKQWMAVFIEDFTIEELAIWNELEVLR